MSCKNVLALVHSCGLS